MKKRKGSWLKWMGLIELLIGALNIMSGGMSFFVLNTQGNQILAQMQTEMGIVVTMQEMMTALLLTIFGGMVMFAAGLIAVMFTGKQGREQLCIIMGVALLVYILVSDIMNVAMGSTISVSMVFPFILHGLYLLGAYKNRIQMQTEAAERKGKI